MFNFNSTQKFYINLDRRPDRRADMEQKFNQLGIDVQRWRAVDSREVHIPSDSAKCKFDNANAIYACALSHISLIRHAQQEKMEYVVIFEDDIEFAPNFMEGVNKIGGYWDMFMLGGHGGERYVRKRYFRVEHCAGTYGYIVKHTAYEYILRNWNYHYGWDEFLGDFAQIKLTVKAKIPWLVNTFPNFSDVAGHYVEYDLS